MNLQLLQLLREQEEEQSVSATRWKFSVFQITIAASLLLHGGLFALAFQAMLVSPLPRPFNKPPIGVVLNRIEAEVEQEVEADQQPESAPSESALVEVIEAEPDPDPDIVETQIIEANPSPEPLPSSEELINAALDELLSDTTANIENPVATSLSPGTLSGSIATFLATDKAVLSKESMEACIRYQNRHGTKDCPQFASAVPSSSGGGNGNSSSGPASNSEQRLPFMASTMNNALANEGAVALAGIGGDGISLLGGAINIAFDGSITFGNALNLQFDLTESGKPEYEIIAEETVPEGAFSVATPLFPAR